jgi:hypothetical protein
MDMRGMEEVIMEAEETTLLLLPLPLEEDKR